MMESPVFVAGLERSGTSLMYALLASHPNISMTRRTNFWRYFVDQYGDLGRDENLDACLQSMRTYKRLVVLDLDFERLRREFVEGSRTYGRLYALAQAQVAERRGKERWGDKSLNIESHTERILTDFPEARILHMIRDPRDRLASVLARWRVRRGDIGAGTAAWLWSARLGAQHSAARPANYMVVRYESLVEAPEAAAREICAFIGEPYSEEMLTMEGAGRFRDIGSNSSYGARAVGTISTDSIGKYKEVLAPRQIAFIQAAAGSELSAHGYDLDPVVMTTGERLRFSAADRPYHRAVMTAWRARAAVSARRATPVPDYRIVEDPA
jgi:Sulfotransferase family